MSNKKHLPVFIPGQQVCSSKKINVAGAGTYEENGYIYSKLVGTAEVRIERKIKTIMIHGFKERSIVPVPGDIVTAMVTQVNQRFCKCTIKCIGDVISTRLYKGIVRKEDVRANEKDRVEMYKSFRPGDIIHARVLAMTEAHIYLLSTAENGLGVVLAHSEEGVSLIPISWTEMQCPKTLVKELRKVAKFVPEKNAMGHGND